MGEKYTSDVRRPPLKKTQSSSQRKLMEALFKATMQFKVFKQFMSGFLMCFKSYLADAQTDKQAKLSR